MTELVLATTSELGAPLLGRIRNLMDEAFAGDFDDDDWDHTLGGRHAVVRDGTAVLAHAALVARTLVVGTASWRTGYVEGVATAPALQGTGLGTRVMTALNHQIRGRFELGALGTGEHHFYERLGWERWQGPTYVDRDGRLDRSAEDDDGVMVLRFGPTMGLDRRQRIVCRQRPGDDW